MTRAALISGLAICLTACTDLSAVRQFASTGSTISSNEPVISSWPGQYDVVLARANSYAQYETAKSVDIKAFTEQGSKSKDAAALATEAAKALGAYLQVLAQLAGGSTADISEPLKGLSAAAAKIAPGNSAATAIGGDALSLLVSAAQNKAVGTVIKGANPAVQVITSYLALTAHIIGLADKSARTLNDGYWVYVGEHSTDASRHIVSWIVDQDDASFNSDISKATAAEDAFTRLGRDHKALADNADSLKSAYVTLQADAPLLQDAYTKLFK